MNKAYRVTEPGRLLGDAIHAQITCGNKTVKEIAKDAGCTPSYVRMVINGTIDRDTDTLKKIALNAFDCNFGPWLEYLAGRDPKKFGSELKAMLADINATEADLARAAHVDISAASRWLSGERCPSPEHIGGIARFFKTKDAL